MIDKKHPAYEIYVQYFQKEPDEKDEDWQTFKLNFDVGVESAKNFLKFGEES
jgi:hypothetical protein